MDTFGPLMCEKCERPIRVDFRARDGDVEYYCKCTFVSGVDLNADLIDGGPDSLDFLEHWYAVP